MVFDVKERNGGMFVTVSGRLDTPAAANAEKEIIPLLENADKEIILDFSKLEYISSSGLRLLLTIRKQAAAKGGRIIIEHISEDIKNVFRMTGFHGLYDIR